MVNKQFEDEVGVTDSGRSKAGIYDSKKKIFVKHTSNMKIELSVLYKIQM